MQFEDTGDFIADAKKEREPRWDENIPWFELPDDDDVHAYRLVAKPYYFAQHWIQTFKKDGKPGKPWPVICQNFDPNTNTYAENGCEVCGFMSELNGALDEVKGDWKNLPQHIQRMTRRMTMATNLIVRDLQEQGAPTANGQWSFIKQAKFPQGFAKTIKEKQDKFNKIGGQVYGLNHVQHGRDLLVSYNSSSDDKNKMYMLELGPNTPITDVEKSHQQYLVDFHQHMKYPNQSELANSLKRNGYYSWLDDYRSSASIVSVPKTQANPVTASAQQKSTPSAFDAGNEMSVPEDDRTVVKANPTTTPKTEAPAAAPVAAQPAPAQPAPVAESAPTTPPPTQAPVAAATPAAATPAAASPAQVVPTTTTLGQKSPVDGKIVEFAAANGIQLRVDGTAYTGKPLKLYRPDLQVPMCWRTYNQTIRENKDLCKKCPLRLDCMLAT